MLFRRQPPNVSVGDPLLRKTARGHILWDLAVSVFFIGIGCFLWIEWQGKKASAPSAEVRGQSADQRSDDTSEKSRKLPAAMRALLSKHGVADADVIKSLNEERGQAPEVYWEQTMAVRAPKGFQPPAFLLELGDLMERENLRLLRNVQENGVWYLDVGEDDKVYEHLEIHMNQPGQGKKKAQ